LATYGEISALAPFGAGNARPLFKWRGEIATAKLFGKTKNHLELSFLDSRSRAVKAIGFFRNLEVVKMSGESVELAPLMEVEITGHIELSVFAGRREVRIRIVDILL
jgi:hypothetical protein